MIRIRLKNRRASMQSDACIALFDNFFANKATIGSIINALLGSILKLMGQYVVHTTY